MSAGSRVVRFLKVSSSASRSSITRRASLTGGVISQRSVAGDSFQNCLLAFTAAALHSRSASLICNSNIFQLAQLATHGDAITELH